MKDIAKYIDYTNLSATTPRLKIQELCEDAIKYGFFSVCVNPFYVKEAKSALKGSNVKVCTVVGFPLGQNTTKAKIYETYDAIKNGADEIDMVINIARLKAGDIEYCLDEINAIKKVCKKRILKVIVETCYLEEKELELACQLVLESAADYIKTSTGFGTAGAQLKDIQIMRALIKDAMGIKAAGGIKSEAEAWEFIDAGATRIGTSRVLIDDAIPGKSTKTSKPTSSAKKKTTKSSSSKK